jgi:hypothetical protein
MGGVGFRLGCVNHIPHLWPLAYGHRHRFPLRLLARAALKVTAFIRLLALADHDPFLTH